MSMNTQTYSAAVLAAEKRRIEQAGKEAVRVEWFINQALASVNLTLQQRVRLAVEYLKTKIVMNISRPVTKTVVSRVVTTPQGSKKTIKEVRVSNRSKPGEFPKADTTLLMKTIFGEVTSPATGVYDGFVGTPLDYGVVLEIRKDRSFLLRTFNEEYSKIMTILSGPTQQIR